MKTFIGTKVIEAKPATMLEATAAKMGTTIDGAKQFCKPEDIDKEGYIVRYPDDYVSWSPKDVFEEAYRECDNMTFGLAIEAMKKGKKVARKGWNGKGMFLFLAETTDIATEADLSEYEHMKGELVLPSVVMKTADNYFCVGWLASQTDMLAEDWVIVE